MRRTLTRRQVLKLGAALGVAGGGLAAGLPRIARAQTKEVVLDYWHPENGAHREHRDAGEGSTAVMGSSPRDIHALQN